MDRAKFKITRGRSSEGVVIFPAYTIGLGPASVKETELDIPRLGYGQDLSLKLATFEALLFRFRLDRSGPTLLEWLWLGEE